MKKDRQWELQGNLPEPQHALEHLGLSAATVTWLADHVRRYESKTQTEPGRFEVWRLDDNGNEALVDVLASEATANCVVQTYEARLHKQTYFVAARVKASGPPVLDDRISYDSFGCGDGRRAGSPR